MDHSVSGYLKMRTTEELYAILNYCLRENNYNSYKYVVPEMLEVLEEHMPLEELSPCVMQYLTKRLQDENRENSQKR